MVEAMIYALDVINSQQGSFLNFKLGAIAMDTCANADYTLTEVMSLMQALRYRTENDELVCPDGRVPEFKDRMKDYPKVIGVVGSMNTDVTKITAYMLNLFAIPQVGYYASSSDLSHSGRFRYFFRTNPSEKVAIKAIIKLLRQVGWHYVSLIQDTSAYSENVVNDFELSLSIDNNLANSQNTENSTQHRICLSEKIKIDLQNQKTYKDAVKDLSKGNPGTVVLVFLPHEAALTFFDTVRQYDEIVGVIQGISLRDKFHWIGLSGWAGRDMDADMNNKVLSRTIAVVPTLHILQNFTEHMKRQIPSISKNPWMKSYFEMKCHCLYNNASSEHYVDCESIEDECASQVFYNYKQLPFVQFIVNAFLAYAHALKSIQDIKCAGQTDCKLWAADFTGPEIRRELKKVHFKDLSGQDFEFNKNTDGKEDFSIIYAYDDKRGWNVGSILSLIDGKQLPTTLNLSKEFLAYISQIPPSLCESNCEPEEVKSTSKDNPCCWSCSKCSTNQYKTLKKKHSNQLVEDEYECTLCPNGTRPDKNLTQCLTIPPIFLSYSEPIAIVVIAYCIFGILTTLFVSFVLFKYQSTPIVKASGRETSFVLLCGIILSFVCPIVILAEPSPVSCGVAFVSPGLCTCVCYAAILAKTSRIARIFQVVKRIKKNLRFTSPLSLVYLMVTMILTEMIILILMIIFEIPEPVYHRDNNINEKMCSKVQGQRIILPGLAFPIILIVLSTLYAFKIRKTPRHFNEGRNLCFLNLANSSIYLSGILVLFIFPENHHWTLCVCFLLAVSATTSMLGAFVNKLYIILFRPSKNNLDEVMISQRPSTESIINYIDLNMKLQSHSSIDSRTSNASLDNNSVDNFHKSFPILNSSHEQARESSTSSNSENTALVHSINSPRKLTKNVSFDSNPIFLEDEIPDSSKRKSHKLNKINPIMEPLEATNQETPSPLLADPTRPILNKTHHD